MASIAVDRGLIYLGMDTSKAKIAVGVLHPDQADADVEVIPNDEACVRRFIDRFADRSRLRVCYEAGPIGYGLYRLLWSLGVACAVVAPSLIPRRPGDRVKTDRRDARRLARLYRAGELVVIRVPSEAEEGVRDLCRARADLVEDRTRTRHRLGKFLLRHDRIWLAEAWTGKHLKWVAAQVFTDPALKTTFETYRGVLAARDAELCAVTAELSVYFRQGPFAEAVARLAAYRGIAQVGALTIASEVGDWRRFPSARTFMGFTGLVPSEYSSGATVSRGHITKAGNAHLRTQLVESAWAYSHRASLGVALTRRQQGVSAATAARSWTAQQRLCSRFRRLDARKTRRNVVTVAIARELAGFLWAEMTATD